MPSDSGSYDDDMSGSESFCTENIMGSVIAFLFCAAGAGLGYEYLGGTLGDALLGAFFGFTAGTVIGFVPCKLYNSSCNQCFFPPSPPPKRQPATVQNEDCEYSPSTSLWQDYYSNPN